MDEPTIDIRWLVFYCIKLGERMDKLSRKDKDPSGVLSEFLSYIDRIWYDYKAAHDAMEKEE